LDSGPIILQAAVPVLDEDNEDSLSARILVQEHQLYSNAIQLVLENRIKVQGRRVLLESRDNQ
jgi:phosphoribosylglycinamide formyltransferase-1